MSSHISILSYLYSHPDGPVSASGDAVFFRQGEIDGACAAYATLTALVALGVVSREEVLDLRPRDGRSKLGKLFNWFHTPQALLRDGMDYSTVWAALKDSYGRDIDIEHYEDTGSRTRTFILDALSKDKVVIVAYGGHGWAHATVAVGVEEQENGNNLLLLDPGFDEPRYCCWNNVLSLSAVNGRYPYRSWRGSENYVCLYDAIALSRRS